ncbi:signal peptide-containing protein [Planctomycetota bacterium]
MVTKCLKIGGLAIVGLGMAGGLFFGKDLVSYARSSAKTVRTAVKDSVPIEFELKRARDLLEEVIPEMHANIRLISQEEVEIAALHADIEKSQNALQEEQERIHKLRHALNIQRASYEFGGAKFSRAQVKQELGTRFERFKEAELVLASKEHLMVNRHKSLQGALQLLDQTRSEKRLLEDKISALEGQYRLVKAASVGSKIDFDSSKLAKTEKLISQIKKRLDVAERVLAHESRFVEAIPVDVVDEVDLLTQIDDHFSPVSDESQDGVEAEITGTVVLLQSRHQG